MSELIVIARVFVFWITVYSMISSLFFWLVVGDTFAIRLFSCCSSDTPSCCHSNSQRTNADRHRYCTQCARLPTKQPRTLAAAAGRQHRSTPHQARPIATLTVFTTGSHGREILAFSRPRPGLLGGYHRCGWLMATAFCLFAANLLPASLPADPLSRVGGLTLTIVRPFARR